MNCRAMEALSRRKEMEVAGYVTVSSGRVQRLQPHRSVIDLWGRKSSAGHNRMAICKALAENIALGGSGFLGGLGNG